MAWYRSKKKGIGEIRSSPIRKADNSLSGFIPCLDNQQYVNIDYNKDWTIKVRVKLTSAMNGNYVVIGTAYTERYYDNPSAELQTGRTSIWWSISQNGSSWSNSQTINFSEEFALNTWYDFEFSFVASTKAQSCKVTKVSNGTVIGSGTRTASGTNYQPNQATYPLQFGNVAFTSRFTGVNKQAYDFAHSYIENDGTVLWGNKD